MKQKRTTAIVLTRVNYGEADRIITVLTPDVGKLSLMAKGVRKVKSKLAGGIELFSTSEITYLPGRGSVSTLVSSRLVRHYEGIVRDINRTMLGYELIALLHRVTEDALERAYYDLLEHAFAALDDYDVSADCVGLWFRAQLIRLAGHTPNMQTNTAGAKLQANKRYEFDYEAAAFCLRDDGSFDTGTIKFLRLLFAQYTPRTLSRVQAYEQYSRKLLPLMKTLQQMHLKAS
ncbi:DNA repair protein RecO [Candidatus Saccharibacteria bacterium]|nr:MAG: DNA repair protein RecO [Candidatus Saccharibacteria bacterium]PID99573.1 MAG: DNA repair protein RecO [Candidatus Saccharibacteria bacterium]